MSERGLSAAKAGKIVKRAAAQPAPRAAVEYTVYDENSKITGTFQAVAKLCPGIAHSTLHRRLSQGERSLIKLKRPPESKTGPHRRRSK